MTDSRGATHWHRPALVVAAVVVMLLAVGVIAGSSPVACSSCHAMRPYAKALDASAHANTDCYACHTNGTTSDWIRFKTVEIARMYPKAILGQGVVKGVGTRVSDDGCEKCHADALSGSSESGGIRILHAACAQGRACDSCHGTVAHGATTRWKREAVMEECSLCHAANNAPTACDTCHAGQITKTRLSAGPWRATHGQNWKATHGLGTLQYCRVCHPSDYCARCHGIALPHPDGFSKLHGQAAMSKGAKCSDCHDQKRFCDACHGVEMPHPSGFLPKHSGIATSRADKLCLKCHEQRDCDQCHIKHIHPGSITDRVLVTPDGTGK